MVKSKSKGMFKIARDIDCFRSTKFKKMKVFLQFQVGLLASLLDLPELLEQVIQFMDESSLYNLILSNKKHFGGDDFILNSVSFWKERLLSSSDLVSYLEERREQYQDDYEREDELVEIERVKAIIEDPNIKDTKAYILLLRQWHHKQVIDRKYGRMDCSTGPYFRLELSPSNRAGCRKCGNKIDKGVIRFEIRFTPAYGDHYENKYYYHLDCLDGLIKKHSNHMLEETVAPSSEKFSKAMEQLRIKYGIEEKPQLCEYVFVCDVCGNMNTGKNNYCCYTCSDDPKNEIDYCQLCHDLGKEKHKDCADFTEEDVLYEFNCCKCSSKILGCMFHCQVCEEGHDICKSCFDKIMEDEKNGKKDRTSEDLTHPFFLIGNAMVGEESNPSKRKEMDDSHSTCESKKRKVVVSLSDYLKSHDF